MRRIIKDILLFLGGGLSYGLIEILWRKHTHWTMIITGGICFVSLYRIFKRLPRLSLPEKCVIGSTLITVAEFFCGCIVNLKFKMQVWDYSSIPLNLIGQICVLYSALWGLLSIPISYICSIISKLSQRLSVRLKQK